MKKSSMSSNLLKGLLEKFESSLLDSYLNNCDELNLPLLHPSMTQAQYISAHEQLFNFSDTHSKNSISWPEYKNYMEKVLLQFRDSQKSQVNKKELYENIKKFRSQSEQ
jgi:hypothetical protein